MAEHGQFLISTGFDIIQLVSPRNSVPIAAGHVALAGGLRSSSKRNRESLAEARAVVDVLEIVPKSSFEMVTGSRVPHASRIFTAALAVRRDLSFLVQSRSQSPRLQPRIETRSAFTSRSKDRTIAGVSCESASPFSRRSAHCSADSGRVQRSCRINSSRRSSLNR